MEIHGDPWAEVLRSFQIPDWKQKGTERLLWEFQKRWGQPSHCPFLKALPKTYFYWRAYPDFTFWITFKRIVCLWELIPALMSQFFPLLLILWPACFSFSICLLSLKSTLELLFWKALYEIKVIRLLLKTRARLWTMTTLESGSHVKWRNNTEHSDVKRASVML